MLLLEARDRAHAVGQQHEAFQVFGGQVGKQIPHGVGHAVAAGFPGNHDLIGGGNPLQQRRVQLRAGVLRVGHFGLQGAVVFGVGVGALDGRHDGALALPLPALQGPQDRMVDAMPPAAQLTVHGPDHVCVASPCFKRLQVVERIGLQGRVGRAKLPRAHRGGRDGRERRHLAPLTGTPAVRMGNIEVLMGVQCHDDVVDVIGILVQPGSQAAHVGMGAGYGQRGKDQLTGNAVGPGRQVTEIVLRIDDQYQGGRIHGVPFK